MRWRRQALAHRVSWTRKGARMAEAQEIDRLQHEHAVLLRSHAAAQARCSALLRDQAELLRRMDAQLMRTRAALVRSETALAWEREDRAAIERSIPGLGRRVSLGRQVAALQTRVHDLMGELHRDALFTGRAAARAQPDEMPAELEASLAAADLVICQTGCLSHGDYWRVQDHCKRTGKVCMLVDRPDGLQIMRIHRSAGEKDAAELATVTDQR